MRVLLFLCFFVCASLVLSESRGWNDNIKWKTLDEGLAAAKQENKPAMVVIHKSWCGACKKLRPQFESSKEIEQMSQHFSMINLMDDEEPSDSAYAPDGGYIPRIIYVSPDGQVRSDSGKYQYFYSSADEVVKGMKNALQVLGTAHEEL